MLLNWVGGRNIEARIRVMHVVHLGKRKVRGGYQLQKYTSLDAEIADT